MKTFKKILSAVLTAVILCAFLMCFATCEDGAPWPVVLGVPVLIVCGRIWDKLHPEESGRV